MKPAYVIGPARVVDRLADELPAAGLPLVTSPDKAKYQVTITGDPTASDTDHPGDWVESKPGVLQR